jgi:hypothetical protein
VTTTVTTTSSTSTVVPCPSGCSYFYTCGWPVCGIPGFPSTGAAPCTTQRAGEPCQLRGEACDPGGYAHDCGQLLLCTDEDPTLRGCPISRRSAKRDIEYLDADAVKRVHDELLKLRLATYRYRGEGASSSERLGFIIDDVGQSPAIDADGARVDLYGYASMAVAAIQAQAREIESLKREVAQLRREQRSACGR